MFLCRLLVLVVAFAMLPGCTFNITRSSTGLFAVVAGDGRFKTEKRDLPVSDRIEVSGPVSVRFVQGDSATVYVSADANLLPLIETRMVDRTLHVDTKAVLQSENPLLVVVEMPTLEACSVKGSGSVQATGLSGDFLKLETLGSGHISANGSVGNLVVEADGSGGIDAFKLVANSVTATVLGSGSVDVFAQSWVKARCYGSGGVRVFGSPRKRDLAQFGSGMIDVL